LKDPFIRYTYVLYAKSLMDSGARGRQVAERYVAETNKMLELLLYMATLNDTTYPRDKVYGMLGGGGV